MELDQLLTTLSTRAIRELAAAQSTANPVETMTDDSLFDETGIVAAFYEGKTTVGAYHYACVIEDPGNFGGYRLASFYVTERPTGSITGDWGGNGYATNPHEEKASSDEDPAWPFPGPSSWPSDLTTFEERSAYQRGARDGMALPRSDQEVMYDYLRKHIVREGFVPREVHHVMLDVRATHAEFDQAVRAAMERRPL